MADESPRDEMKHTCSVKPLLGTLDMVTSAPSNSQSQPYGQAQSHWDEVPVGKYYEITCQRAQKNNPVTRKGHLFWNYELKCVLLKNIHWSPKSQYLRMYPY